MLIYRVRLKQKRRYLLSKVQEVHVRKNTVSTLIAQYVNKSSENQFNCIN